MGKSDVESGRRRKAILLYGKHGIKHFKIPVSMHIRKEESILKTMEVPGSILGVEAPSAQETDDVGRLQLTGL